MSSDDYVTHADVGGQLGHGPIQFEPDGKVWRAAWEPRVFAMHLSMGGAGAWNIDMSRAARESLPDYEKLTYYEIWFAALLKQLEERGLVSADEVIAGRSLHAPVVLPRFVHARDVPTLHARGAPTERPATKDPRFTVGTRVRTTVAPMSHHTRLPRYAEDKPAVIERVHGMHVFPDTNAGGHGEQPQWLYTVVFQGTELWPDAEPGLTVSIDAWEPYLEAT